MPKFIKKLSKKVGLAPGTLVHVGKKQQAKSRITVIDYTKDSFEQKEAQTVAEAYAYRDKKSVTWINIDGLEELDVIKSIDSHFGIHELVAEDIVNTGHRPKIEDHEDYLFIIIKMLSYDTEAKDVKSEQVSFILGHNYVISFQEKIGDVFDPIRKRIKAGKGRSRKMGADYLAYILLDAVIDHYFAVLEKIGEEIEILEEKMMKEVSSEMTEEIHYMKRDMIFLRKQIWPLREVVSSLLRDESKLISKGIGIFLRDAYDHTIQIMDTIESYRDVVSGLHDIYLSSMSNRMNEIMKVLTIFAAIFIPLTFVAGIYGMNFENMPELKWPNGYFMALGMMATLGIGLVVYFKTKKWF